MKKLLKEKFLKVLGVLALLGLLAGASVGAGMYFGVINTPESVTKLGDDDSATKEQPDASSAPASDAGEPADEADAK